MSRKYKFHDSRNPYFISYATVHWIDLFTRRIYFDIIVHSLSYCIDQKGLILNAWCIMTNHVHLIIRSEINDLPDIVRDMKKFTSKRLIECILNNAQESRKEWILNIFGRAGHRNSNNKTWQVWQQHNHPVELGNNKRVPSDKYHLRKAKVLGKEAPVSPQSLVDGIPPAG